MLRFIDKKIFKNSFVFEVVEKKKIFVLWNLERLKKLFWNFVYFRNMRYGYN